jgi:hypothetical protein
MLGWCRVRARRARRTGCSVDTARVIHFFTQCRHRQSTRARGLHPTNTRHPYTKESLDENTPRYRGTSCLFFGLRQSNWRLTL